MNIKYLIENLREYDRIGLTDVYIGKKYDIDTFLFNDDRCSVDLIPIKIDKNKNYFIHILKMLSKPYLNIKAK